MKPIRVLHVTSVDKENYYFNNLVDFSDPGTVEYEFITFAPYCDFAKSLETRGRTVHCLNTLRRKDYPRAVKEVWHIFKLEEPDIVHTHGFDPSLMALTVAKWQGRTTVMTRHHSDPLYRIKSKLKRNFYLSLERYEMGRADHIIAPARMVRDVMVERQGVPKDKVTVIPYGQTSDRFENITRDQIERVRSELGMDRQLSIVYPARLDNLKGHKYLFEALSPLVSNGLKANVYLVGTGPYRDEIEKMVSLNGLLEHVVFLGWRDDALAIMAGADIVAQPSLTEALSSVTIEALMLERPIVATDVSGVRDSLDNGNYGRIVPPSDAESFRIGLRETIENLDLARAKAVAGRKYLLEYMDARRVSRAYENVYARVINGNVFK